MTMLKLAIPGGEFFDERTETFLHTKDCVLTLEHSLLSISKWESKWHKPFITDKPKSYDESVDYVRCMSLTRDIDPLVYSLLRPEHFKKIDEYMEDKMTATWFSNKEGGRSNREIITSEVIYYWMVSLGIPFECEKWHLNRLLTLIRVCNEKNAPDKKMSRKEQMSQQRLLNAARRQKLHSHG